MNSAASKTHDRPRWAALLAPLALALVLVAGCSDAPQAVAFDSAAWLSAGPGNVTTFTERGRMSADLVTRVLRPGMSRTAAMTLLGEPDQPPTPTEVVYYLGKSDSFVSRIAFLVLYFDGERLVRVRIAED